MYDPQFAIKKLEELAKLSSDSPTEYEKAALYGAAFASLDRLADHMTAIELNIHEKIIEAKDHFACLLGFDSPGGHSLDQHHVWIYGALSTLSRRIESHRR